MKVRLLLLIGLTAVLPLGAQTNVPATIYPDEDAQTPESLRLVWPTTPGVRYEVQESTNLQTWLTAPGFPAAAPGPAQQMPFAPAGNARFFQVRELDEEPPAIVSQYPTDGGFAVPRFANLTLQLTDATGINTNSIQLTVGNLGAFALPHAQLTFTNDTLIFLNGGSIPLGDWGANVQASLIVADTLGNSGTNTWTFDLEIQPQVVTNLFVFGSPQAQRTGQRIGNIPTAALAQSFGPIRANDGDPWTLELVESNRLEISYTNAAPAFALNQYICNLTPAAPEEIFNRKVTAISDDLEIKRLTLYTVEVPLTELATNASVTITGDSRLLETGTNGTFIQMFSIDGTVPFPRIGYSLDGVAFTLKNASGFNLVNLALEEQHSWLTPTLQVSMEINSGSLQRFEAIAKGRVESASIWNADFLLAGVAAEATLFDLPEHLEPKKWLFLGYVGLVPVFASLGFDVKLKARAEVNATLDFRAGKRETADAAFGLTYTKPNPVQWIHTFHFAPPQVVPFSGSVSAEGSLRVTLEPAVEFLIYGLAGFSAGIAPGGGAVFEAGTEDCIRGRFEADVSLDLGLAGPAFELLNPQPELSVPVWADQWPLFGCTNLVFTQQPQNQNVPPGIPVYFSCLVESSEPPTYQWYFNQMPLVGQNARTLLLPNVSYGHAGNYWVRVTAGSLITNSTMATLTVASNIALIPAGSFVMGDFFNEGEVDGRELPLHSVYVSAFYMDKYEVTKGLWDEVQAWGLNNGYTDLPVVGGKAANHPAQEINWYAIVKWCNARSEKDGLVPAYYTSAAQTTIYRTGNINIQNEWVKWHTGYRLPTEAEWEKAARGGNSGWRFPWGNTITHGQANYYSSNSLAYDTSSTRGYHPTFAIGNFTYTSPVGYFAANGYGLHDMAGNVYEWCWDWWSTSYYSSSPLSDPKGPASGDFRVIRGGSWRTSASVCRMAARITGTPGNHNGNYFGFRCVQTAGQ